MKKNILLFFGVILVLTGCINKDPLYDIRRMTRYIAQDPKNKEEFEKELDNKKKASQQYKQAIDVMVNAYISYGSLNKDIGKRLIVYGDYMDAVKHFEASSQVRNQDSEVYYYIGLCYVNLYKTLGAEEYLDKAGRNYEIAYNLSPYNKDILYGYAHFLVYGKPDYQKAIELLKKYIYESNQVKSDNPKVQKFVKNKKIKPTNDPKAFFLLGRVYYMIEDYENAYKIFNEMYDFKNLLTSDEKEALDEFIITTKKELNNE
jgi:tetratricopeptide (TPR) repeat protein